VWKKISSGFAASWHDHRTHYMGFRPPPAITAHPDRAQVVIRDWVLPLRMGTTDIEVHGDVLWVPGPSPFPWFVVGGACALAVMALAVTELWRPTAVVAGALLLVIGVVDVVADLATRGPSPAVLWTALTVAALVGLTVGLGGTVRDRRWAVALLGAAGLVLSVQLGWSDLSALSHSQIPPPFGPLATRAVVSISSGLGLGLAGLAVVRWSRPESRLAQSAANNTFAKSQLTRWSRKVAT
jgi:hypothetical protein